MTTTEAVVRRYFAVVADLGSTAEELEALLHPEAVFVEFPNAIAPEGHERDVAATMRGFIAGKQRLSSQRIDVHEILVSGERAAVRSTWHGTIEATQVTAHMAGWITVRDGRVLRHETYDCYEPLRLER
jgi:ketosteroid isomerase-like protein